LEEGKTGREDHLEREKGTGGKKIMKTVTEGATNAGTEEEMDLKTKKKVLTGSYIPD